MKRIVTLFIATGVVLSSSLYAQTNAPVAETPTAAVTCPATTTLEELIKAIDAAVSGPTGKDRTCFRALMMPGATMNPLAKSADGAYVPRVLSVDGWIENVKKRGDITLSEHQIRVSSETYGHIAHMWSTYELHMSTKGAPVIRGINSIQAVYDGKAWRIFEILWQAETPEEPIPAKYLP
jgi:hypothetical protein